MFSFFCKKYIVLLFSLLVATVLFANTKASDDNWIIAVANFDSNIEDDSTAEFIARTVLQNIPIGTKRTVTIEEQLRQDSYAIDQEISKLYTNLQKKVLERDSIVVNVQETDFEKDIAKKQEEIDTIQFSIKEKQDQKKLLSLDNYVPLEKNIALWKNSAEKLYEVSDAEFFNPSDIHALITGSVEHIDSFVHVNIQLTLFPGRVIEFEYKDVERIDLIKNLSVRISDELLVQYSNKMPITINFAMSPVEAQENAILQINGTPYKKQEGDNFVSLNLTNGIYEIYIESPGYKSVALTQYFGGEDIINVEVSLQKQFSAKIEVPELLHTGDLFLNAQKTQENASTVTINTIPVLGEFIKEDGVSTWFIIDSENTSANFENSHLAFELNEENPANIIEKKRKIMYNSYAALVASLPIYFILNGQYINEHNSWASGNASGDSVKSWEMAKNISMGASIGLGVNFLIQLGLYIYSVNAILPETITVE